MYDAREVEKTRRNLGRVERVSRAQNFFTVYCSIPSQPSTLVHIYISCSLLSRLLLYHFPYPANPRFELFISDIVCNWRLIGHQKNSSLGIPFIHGQSVRSFSWPRLNKLHIASVSSERPQSCGLFETVGNSKFSGIFYRNRLPLSRLQSTVGALVLYNTCEKPGQARLVHSPSQVFISTSSHPFTWRSRSSRRWYVP